MFEFLIRAAKKSAADGGLAVLHRKVHVPAGVIVDVENFAFEPHALQRAVPLQFVANGQIEAADAPDVQLLARLIRRTGCTCSFCRR